MEFSSLRIHGGNSLSLFLYTDSEIRSVNLAKLWGSYSNSYDPSEVGKFANTVWLNWNGPEQFDSFRWAAYRDGSFQTSVDTASRWRSRKDWIDIKIFIGQN